MYTIDSDGKYELVIKNSRFITLLYKIDAIDDVDQILSTVKEEYPGATHYCYAYIIDNYKRGNDDGEPSGTAGIPILKVLESNELTNILIVVVRYFGGIKLGANGLIRAYTKCVSNALKEREFKELVDGMNIDITFDYSKIKEMDYLLKDYVINNKVFGDKVIYNLNISKGDIIKIQEFDYHINNLIKIEK